jgi:hypothetical protein
VELAMRRKLSISLIGFSIIGNLEKFGAVFARAPEFEILNSFSESRDLPDIVVQMETKILWMIDFPGRFSGHDLNDSASRGIQ